MDGITPECSGSEEYIQFEKPVKLPEGDGKIHTRYIDGYIPAVKVLIEQKELEIIKQMYDCWTLIEAGEADFFCLP